VDQKPETELRSPPGGKQAGGGDQLWSAFVGARESGEFCNAWLALQCQAIPVATAGLLLLQRDDATYAPAAIWPDPRRDVTYLKKTAHRALMERRAVIQSASEAGNESANVSRVYIGYPIDIRGRLYGVVVLDVLSRHGVDLQEVLRQLHWGTGWLEGLFWRVQSEQESRKLGRTTAAVDLVSVAEEHAQFETSAIAVANELAARLKCDRVTIGFRIGNRIRLKAMSHSAWFEPRSQLVGGIENAMEESFDQNASVAYPPIVTTQRRVSIAHQDFSKAWRIAAMATVVMKNKGQAVGAITLERQSDGPFEPETLLQAELAATLAGPILGLKLKANDWLAGRLWEQAQQTLKRVFGPKHPAAKLAACLALGVVVFLATATTEFRVSAKSVLEGAVQRAAVAPFDGYIAEAPVRAGDIVRDDQTLAVLKNNDLMLEKTRWELEKQKLEQKRRDALAKHDRTSILILAEEIGEAESQLALVNTKLDRTRIAAPIDGMVVSGDLSQMLGAPVSQGKVLFEITPLSTYRVVLQVDERDIRYVSIAQNGLLSLTGSSAKTLPFTVSKVTSVATAEDGRNFFRVEASLAENDLPLRPGMEGIGKIEAGRRSLLWTWTRALVERVKLFLWAWTP
jgi:multidrug efflux pump subunit AcrA (membrane-fusion protein)